MLIVALCSYTPSLLLDSFMLWLLHLIFKYSRCLSSSRNVCWAPPGSMGLSLGAMGLHRADSKMWKCLLPLRSRSAHFISFLRQIIALWFLNIFSTPFSKYLVSTDVHRQCLKDLLPEMNESEILWICLPVGMVHFVLIIVSARTHLFEQQQNMAPCLTTSWSIANSILSGNTEKILQYQILF